MRKPSSYFSFLLRLWKNDGPNTGWRASLEDPHTHETRGFANLEALVNFLQTLGTRVSPPALSDSDSDIPSPPEENRTARKK